MLFTTPRTSRPRPLLIAATLITSATLATVLTGCGGGGGGAEASGKSEEVASVEKDGKNGKGGKDGKEGGNGPAGQAKKYKVGSPELDKAFDAWKAEMKTCQTRKAQELGIETQMGSGPKAGEVYPKATDVEGQNKFFSQVRKPCQEKNPAPEAEDDGNKADTLATAKKQYECLKKAGLGDLHEPTNDNPALFTSEGTQKYFGQEPDPKSMKILKDCGIG
ncbi:hypothetical protein [Streptomyces luteireticuli]|uniref:hypothetical protein n=1 Tax=Streptomyces luteireticuli TaxID=173858 RepID=UPI0035581369